MKRLANTSDQALMLGAEESRSPLSREGRGQTLFLRPLKMFTLRLTRKRRSNTINNDLLRPRSEGRGD